MDTTLQRLLDELARMEARLTGALAGRCGEQSARARTPSSDDGSTPSYLASTSAAVDNFTFACAHTNMGEPVGVAGFGRGPLSLPGQLSPQISGTIHAHELRPDFDPCCAYRDSVQHHRVEAPSAEEDPQPQAEVVESSESESAHPPPVVYDRYVEHDFYSFIPLLFRAEQPKEEEVPVDTPTRCSMRVLNRGTYPRQGLQGQPSSLVCPLVRRRGGGFRLWFDPSVLVAPRTRCRAERMTLSYDADADDYCNAPDVETRVSDFGSTSTLSYLEPDLKLPTRYRNILASMLEKAGYEEGRDQFGVLYESRYGLAGPGQPSQVGNAYLQRLRLRVESACAANGGRPAILVAHNLCGLFALQLLACSPLQWRAAHVQRLGTLSTPWGDSVQEMLKNIFDCLYCVFRALENKERLVKAEGVEFMIIMQPWPPPMQFQASYTHNIWYPFGCGWDAVPHKQPWPPPVFRSLMYEEGKGNDSELGDIHVSVREGATDGKVQLVILGDGVQVWIPPWPSFSGEIQQLELMVLSESESSPTLLSDRLSPQFSGVRIVGQPLMVKVANGQVFQCTCSIPEATWSMSDCPYVADLKSLTLPFFALVVGMDWWQRHSLMKVDWDNTWTMISYNGSTRSLQGILSLFSTGAVVALLLISEEHQVKSSVDQLQAIEEVCDLLTEEAQPEVVPELSKHLLMTISADAWTGYDAVTTLRLKGQLPQHELLRVANGRTLSCRHQLAVAVWNRSGYQFSTKFNLLTLTSFALVDELGLEVFWGRETVGLRELNWFAVSSWNMVLKVLKVGEYDYCSEFLELATEFFSSVLCTAASNVQKDRHELLVLHLLVGEKDVRLLADLEKNIIARGAELNDLAVEHSLCPSKENSGHVYMDGANMNVPDAVDHIQLSSTATATVTTMAAGDLPSLATLSAAWGQAAFQAVGNVNDATRDMTEMVRQQTKLQQESRLKDKSKGAMDKSKEETGTATGQEQGGDGHSDRRVAATYEYLGQCGPCNRRWAEPMISETPNGESASKNRIPIHRDAVWLSSSFRLPSSNL